MLAASVRCYQIFFRFLKVFGVNSYRFFIFMKVLCAKR